MEKLSINLLQADLIPQQPLWTLQRVTVLWSVSLVLMIVWMFYSQYQLANMSDKFSLLEQENQKNSEYLTNLENKVRQNKADAVLQEKLETIKLLLVNKKSLHEKLTDASSTYAAGFSTAMTELSELHHKDISIKKVKMNAEYMTFFGVARNPDAVPSWLAAFEGSTFLSGQHFSQFSLNENEEKLTEFTVSSYIPPLDNKEGK